RLATQASCLRRAIQWPWPETTSCLRGSRGWGGRAPTLAIIVTSVAMIVVIVAFDVSAVAKLASAFQLLLFGLLCLAVIVMRESRIEGYDPGFRSPLYPWMQLAGIAVSIFLVAEMGALAIGFTFGMVALCAVWFYFWVRKNVTRRGAVFHCFERLGRHIHRPLDDELAEILAERRIARRHRHNRRGEHNDDDEPGLGIPVTEGR